MTLNPQVQALLDMMANAPQIDWGSASPQEVRAMYDQQMAVGEPIAMARVADVAIPLDGRTLDARLYVPEGAGEKPPLTVFYHGGGWVIGTLDTHDATCRVLARESGAAVLSIAYRLAPEHRYPAAPHDCYDALVWAASHAEELGIDGARLAVAGDSAGGNLAAIVAILARDHRNPPLRHQLLIYPVTDHDFSLPSYDENGGGEYFLGTDTMRWFWNHYLGGASSDHAPLATVLRTEDLEGLAPATVITAQYDPLRDEGRAYADKLTAAGIATEYHEAAGMIHGFFSMFEAIPDAFAAIRLGAGNLTKAFKA